MLKSVLSAVLVAAVAVPAAAEIPVPRFAPRDLVVFASLSPTPTLTTSEAIRAEAVALVPLAVSNFYRDRDFKPAWPAERAKALRDRLAAATLDGLNPADYFVPHGMGKASEDVALTEAALAFANHAYSGRLDPKSVSPIMTMVPPKLDEARFLRRLARTPNIGKTLDKLSPQHAGFTRLRAALAKTLKARPDPRVLIGKGPNLKRGQKSPRVAALRSRLNATVLRGNDPTQYDAGLLAAVKAFQKSKGLAADGIVGPRTVRALDGVVAPDDRTALISNMERWRWLPRGLGGHHVFVNIPEYRVRVISGGTETYNGRVIVGSPRNPTPIFSDEIEHVVVNPYWNVPFSIAKNEMLGGIQSNPSGYFARRNYEAVVGGRVVNPASLDWHAGMLHRVRIRQRPGRSNALGAVKFLFPNKHAVYLHDTPSKGLFRRDRRALSHGCVRVQNPFDFASALLKNEPKMSGSSIRRMVGGSQRWLNTADHIPVHLTYFTRTVDADGQMKRFGDIYGYDARTQRRLKL
ncbi:MAG: L,D-transpeptidase family protein [Pseudomonadota bacterium]